MASTSLRMNDQVAFQRPGWLPLAVVPTGIFLLGQQWPAWVWMWSLAFALYASLKWWSYAACPLAADAPRARQLGYLILWPGMNADRFFSAGVLVPQPKLREVFLALGNLGLGLALIGIAVQRLAAVSAADTVFTADTASAAETVAGVDPRWAWGWMGMFGVGLALHFGLFALISFLWRRAGVDAPPIMHAPILARSPSDFWGRRWNRAFRDLSHNFIYEPLYPRIGLAQATLAVFLVSGLIHDVVMSATARGGWGLPTLYFLMQGTAVLVERSRLGRKVGLRSPGTGRAFAALVVIVPLPWLFTEPFIRRIVVPMLEAIGQQL